MSQILGIKFSDHGPVCYFASGLYVLRIGQCVLVETDQGLALGRVATVAAPETAALSGPEGAVGPDDGAGRLEESETPETSGVAEASVSPVAAAATPAEPAPFEFSLGIAEWGGMEAAAAPGAPAPAMPGLSPENSAQGSVDGFEASSEGTATPHAPLFVAEQAGAQPVPHSLTGLQLIHRLATEEDLSAHEENRHLARRAFTFCRSCISAQSLDMKLVDVEVLHDRSKIIFFFTAPNRIDFRELIKSLVREFHTRIELRQIGVRHETQMIGAIGNCGQVCCCRRFLRKFAPVTIKMAKEQNLFLNPAKISGICGRLLCCLSYEQKGYEEFHKQCPKIGKRVQTPLGNVKVLRANFFKKSISVWIEDEGEREFTLEEWKDMLNRQPGDAPLPAPVQEGVSARPGRSRPSTGRPTRPDRAPRAERSEKAERPERPERSERQGQPEKMDRPDRPDRPVRPGRTGQSDRPPRPPRAERPAPIEGEVPPAAAAGEPRAESAEGEGRERHRPRRKRRKSRGPKPE